jgi:hypothetical protein
VICEDIVSEVFGVGAIPPAHLPFVLPHAMIVR